MSCPPYWQEAIDYLATTDRVLADLIATYPDEMMINYHNPFGTLVRAIIGQQISVKAAATISSRLETLLGDISPQNYLALDESQVRECGLSRSKIRYITNIAQALEQGVLTPLTWHSMTDRAVAEQLISIPGIGMWTAEMFLIFHLHRADILPLGDIGLIKAIELHYAAGNKLTKAEILDLARPWQPYRTVATWYLWRSLDPHPVQY